MLIDDFSGEELFSPVGSKRRGVRDRVMGIISIAGVTRNVLDGQTCLLLAGEFRTENGGGFIQASLSFSTDGEHLDATDFVGSRLSVCDKGEMYSVHIHTPACGRAWQSYLSQSRAQPQWETVTLPLTSLEPHRPESPLDESRLTRMGLVDLGRPF